MHQQLVRIVIAIAAMCVAVPAFAGSTQGWVYWTESGSSMIKRAHLDGTGVEILYSSVDGVSAPVGLTLDADADQLYWSEQNGGIKRGNLDGTTTPVTIIPSRSPLYPSVFNEIAADFGSGTLYWIPYAVGKAVNNSIYKANLDGTQVVELPVGDDPPSALAIDPEAGKLYFAVADDLGCGPAKIQRANLDGSMIEDVITGLTIVQANTVDPDAGMIYWAEHQSCGVNSIRRGDPAGGKIETLVPEVAGGIALDLAAGKMYWTRFSVIRRADLDGTDVQSIVTVGVQGAGGIAVVPAKVSNPADLNGDGVVNGIDLAILLGAWGRCPPKGACDPDLNGDGWVNGFDLAILLGSWG